MYQMHFQFAVLAGAVMTVLFAGCPRPTAPAAYTNAGSVQTLREKLGTAAAAPETVVTTLEPKGFATIRGKFTLVGAAPMPEALSITKDMSVCMPGGKPVYKEDLVVDANGGIKDVVIYLADKKYQPAWEHADYAAKKNDKIVFDQKNCVFLDHMFAVRSTQIVVLKNSDSVGHNTNLAAKGKTLATSVTIASNDTTEYKPGGESPEPFDVGCNIHPWMSAKMIVRDNPYFAVTKADGSFEIKDVPAGVPLEFRVWQESAKFVKKVNLNGKDVTWSQGKLLVTLQDGKDEVLDVKVTPENLGK